MFELASLEPATSTFVNNIAVSILNVLNVITRTEWTLDPEELQEQRERRFLDLRTIARHAVDWTRKFAEQKTVYRLVNPKTTTLFMDEYMIDVDEEEPGTTVEGYNVVGLPGPSIPQQLQQRIGSSKQQQTSESSSLKEGEIKEEPGNAKKSKERATTENLDFHVLGKRKREETHLRRLKCVLWPGLAKVVVDEVPGVSDEKVEVILKARVWCN